MGLYSATSRHARVLVTFALRIVYPRVTSKRSSSYCGLTGAKPRPTWTRERVPSARRVQASWPLTRPLTRQPTGVRFKILSSLECPLAPRSARGCPRRFQYFQRRASRRRWCFQMITNLAEAAPPQLEALDETRTFVPIPVLKKNQSQAISLILDATNGSRGISETDSFRLTGQGESPTSTTLIVVTTVCEGVTEGERNLVGN